MASCTVSTACLGYYSNHSNSTTVDAAVFDWQQCLTAFAWSVGSWRLAHVHDQLHVPKAPCACVSCAVLQAEHARRREAEQQLKVVKMQLVSEHTRPGRRGSKTITGEEGAITECAWTGGWGVQKSGTHWRGVLLACWQGALLFAPSRGLYSRGLYVQFLVQQCAVAVCAPPSMYAAVALGCVAYNLLTSKRMVKYVPP